MGAYSSLLLALKFTALSHHRSTDTSAGRRWQTRTPLVPLPWFTAPSQGCTLLTAERHAAETEAGAGKTEDPNRKSIKQFKSKEKAALIKLLST